MRSFLLQPYPFSDNVRKKLLVCGGVGLFIFLFLVVFEPFGFNSLVTGKKWLHALAFGSITFVVSALLQIGVPKLLPQFFREEDWRSWKEIVYLLVTTLFIGVGNYGLTLLLYPQASSLTGFFKAQLITLQVGVFPVVFLVFLKQMSLYRRYAAEAKTVSAGIEHSHEKTLDLQALPLTRLVLRGDNQNEELALLADDLLLLASADNYVKVQFREGSALKSLMLRSSLKRLEEQLLAYPQFLRCHRMYIANLQVTEKLTGNAQGLKLHLSGIPEPIPVSRSLTETVREKLQRLSHSRQNA